MLCGLNKTRSFAHGASVRVWIHSSSTTLWRSALLRGRRRQSGRRECQDLSTKQAHEILGDRLGGSFGVCILE